MTEQRPGSTPGAPPPPAPPAPPPPAPPVPERGPEAALPETVLAPPKPSETHDGRQGPAASRYSHRFRLVLGCLVGIGVGALGALALLLAGSRDDDSESS